MRHVGPGVRGRGGGPARRQQAEVTWPVPPRYTRWDVVQGARLELRDPGGAVLAWVTADRTRPAVQDPAGRPLVVFRPAAASQLTGRGAAALTAGAVPAGQLVPAPGGPAMAPLTLQDVPAGLTFARIEPGPGGAARVGILPAGRLNDRRLALALSPGRVAQLRQASPLRYAVDPLGAAELSDPAGRVLARADGGAAGQPPRSIEVGDNDLPAAWLFAIVLGCRGWQR